MRIIKILLHDTKIAIGILLLGLIVALAISIIPRTGAEINDAEDSRLGLGVVYERTGQEPNYIRPQFKVFSAEGDYTDIVIGGDVEPTCLDYPDLILPEADHGWPFAVFEVRDNPYCNLSVFVAPVGFMLNYALALAFVIPSWIIVSRKLKK